MFGIGNKEADGPAKPDISADLKKIDLTIEKLVKDIQEGDIKLGNIVRSANRGSANAGRASAEYDELDAQVKSMKEQLKTFETQRHQLTLTKAA